MLSKNYTLQELGKIDIAPMVEEFKILTDRDWDFNTERQKTPDSAQKNTKFIPIIYYGKNYYLDKFQETIYVAKSAIQGVLGEIDIGRAIFTELPAGMVIGAHKDSGIFLETYTRIHIPLISNDKVSFGVKEGNDWRTQYLEPGKFYALNNCKTFHAVHNKSNVSRYHLIVDVKKQENRAII